MKPGHASTGRGVESFRTPTEKRIIATGPALACDDDGESLGPGSISDAARAGARICAIRACGTRARDGPMNRNDEGIIERRRKMEMEVCVEAPERTSKAARLEPLRIAGRDGT